MDADNEIARSIGRLEGKVSQFIDTMKVYVDQNEKKVALLEERIGRVEKKTWYAAGATAVITFVVTKLGISGIMLK